jgi:uncharacterized membrane protein YdjX (TVP38/TMEM64 family)
MRPTPSNRRYRLIILFILLFAAGIIAFYYRDWLWQTGVQLYAFFSDRDRIEKFILGFGIGAPEAFILVQVLQVLFAPVPGEATGFIGGYLFGTMKGFIYSTVGLTLGSWLNFAIGRFLGRRYIRKRIPDKHLTKLDRLLRKQGVLAVFLMFVFPGFPKDYLSLFLGVTTIPTKVFLILASIGRMPGTLVLSLQGDLLFEQNYWVFAISAVVFLLIGALSFRHRQRLYDWMEKYNNNKNK